MSNCYTAFSASFAIRSPEELEWWEAVESTQNAGAEYGRTVLQRLGIEWNNQMEYILENFPHLWPSFTLEVHEEAQLVRLYAEESSDFEILACIMQACLRRFRPQEVFSLTWADYCDKPVLGGFGGGVLVVTADEIITETSGETQERLSREALQRVQKGE